MRVLKLLPRGINEVFRDHVARRDAAAVPTEPQQNNQFQRHSAGYPGAQNSCHDQPARRRIQADDCRGNVTVVTDPSCPPWQEK